MLCRAFQQVKTLIAGNRSRQKNSSGVWFISDARRRQNRKKRFWASPSLIGVLWREGKADTRLPLSCKSRLTTSASRPNPTRKETWREVAGVACSWADPLVRVAAIAMSSVTRTGARQCVKLTRRMTQSDRVASTVSGWMRQKILYGHKSVTKAKQASIVLACKLSRDPRLPRRSIGTSESGAPEHCVEGA
jgi:hypothetical protein